MIISHSHRFIFVKSLKTAGTDVYKRQGVAWAVVLAQSLFAVQLYWLTLQALPTRVADLCLLYTSRCV